MAPRVPPRELLDTPDDWPDGHADDPAARRAQALARNLADALDDQRMSMRAAATLAGLAMSTVSRIAAGRTWADTLVVARLEHALGRQLWPPPGQGGE